MDDPEAERIAYVTDHIADMVIPRFKAYAPLAYEEMIVNSPIAASCRVGSNPAASPFSSVTALFKKRAHPHMDHNLDGGTTVLISFSDKEAATRKLRNTEMT